MTPDDRELGAPHRYRCGCCDEWLGAPRSWPEWADFAVALGWPCIVYGFILGLIAYVTSIAGQWPTP